jgi:IS5 family transposase
MASLLYLKHTFALSDEDVVERWTENPYWQHFSGERYFRHELPCDPSSLVRWRQRIGEEGCEWLLEHSIKAALSAGVMKRQSLDTVIVDTTVQPKAGEITGVLKTRIETAQRLHTQKRDSKNKLYALHAPEVECIAKGKASTPYEFGVKTSVAVTAKEGVVVGMRSMPGSPYDGHTLHSQLEQVEILTGAKPSMGLADRGCRGVPPPEGTRLLIGHTRGLAPSLKKLLKRRQPIEPTIGHMKTDGLLAGHWLKGSDGDAIHAVLCGAGHNLRLILAHLRVLVFVLIVLTRYAANAVKAVQHAMAATLGIAVRGAPTARPS